MRKCFSFRSSTVRLQVYCVQLLLVSVMIMLALPGCQSLGSGRTAVSDSTYTLSGKVEGLDSGWLYVFHRNSDSGTLDSTKVRNGQFTLTGKASPIPEFCLLGLGTPEGKEFRKSLFLQNGTLSFTGKKDSLESAVITGVPAQEEYREVAKLEKPIDSISSILESIYSGAQASGNQRLMDSVKNTWKDMENREKQLIKDYTRTHPTSYVAAYKVYSNFSYNPDAAQLDSIYTTMDSSVQHSYYGIKIAETLASAKKTAIGQPAPEFSLPDTKGNPVSLSSLKGKFVLVDFWASWCGPCRQENPNVVKAYRQFHPKGFTILGVSLDDSKDHWLEAIQKDKLSWTHVSDLQGWKSTAANLYGVKGIPMNFLLDKEGRIVGKGLRGEDLEKKLQELVK